MHKTQNVFQIDRLSFSPKIRFPPTTYFHHLLSLTQLSSVKPEKWLSIFMNRKQWANWKKTILLPFQPFMYLIYMLYTYLNILLQSCCCCPLIQFSCRFLLNAQFCKNCYTFSLIHFQEIIYSLAQFSRNRNRFEKCEENATITILPPLKHCHNLLHYCYNLLLLL